MLARACVRACALALRCVYAPDLDRYLEIATERHGSFDTYLEAAIGVDDALREALIARFVA